uniref:deoxyhypusine synthase n=2 Tax=Rhodosorus marinus TaxID=101924 RepID=A0A7S0FZZ7_9RHOD|mmetsp:Transcript_10666/g.15422  ORF Transcript_10666/g.15422 Transcript_10666/m.15422 type:complete len:374 (+) Transcript_10666:194-1315(+)
MAVENDSMKNATYAVLVKSSAPPEFTDVVKGHDFVEVSGEKGSNDVNYNKLLQSYLSSGFQATNFGLAVKIVEQMIQWMPPNESLEDKSMSPDDRCTIFLGYTSNLISSGVRETIRFLVQHKMVDVVVTTAGGVEEDLIKCLGSTYLGDFKLDGKKLRQQGINRIGNLVVPNENYCKFEDWLMPILDKVLEEQDLEQPWTPSTLIQRLGREINDESSVCYWASRNNIPIFCPALTDGSLGDMIFFHSYRKPGLVIDLVQDIRAMNKRALDAKQSGMIILGGGVVKHHICNANLMRNGADFAVYMNTGQEFDGSDSGASPDEAVSWGKIRPEAQKVKVSVDASLMFPLLVAETFAKRVDHFKSRIKSQELPALS